NAPVRLNADVYRGEYSNLQRTAILVDSGTLFVAFLNAPHATVQGVELDGKISLTSFLDLSAFYAYTDAYYTGSIPALLGNLTTFNYTPRNQFGIRSTVTLPIDERLGDVSVTADYSYQSTTYNNGVNSRVPGYGVLNLRGDWKGIMGSNFDLGLFANNAL